MGDRHLVSDRDLSPEDVRRILELSRLVKSNPRDYEQAMKGKTMAMIFMKPSTRTRVSFEAGMAQMSGHTIFLTPDTTQIGREESVADTARVLSRFVDVIVARVFDQSTVAELAQHATVPVINGLSDLLHPVQILADLFTISERWPSLERLKLVYVGDGNNVCHSLMLQTAKVGMRMAAICPPGYGPEAEIVRMSEQDAEATGAQLSVTHDLAAVEGGDVVYTDTWVSMGQEKESAGRLAAFQGYQVDAAVMARAKPTAIFMHCLPAHRGEEVAAEVIDGPQSIVFDQAENRLHVQKALVLDLLGDR